MKRTASVLASSAVALSALTSVGLATGPAAPPATIKKPVTDTYHGQTVSDDYRWLEDWQSPDVQSWSNAQNLHARAFLDALPGVPDIRARLTQLEAGASAEFFHLHQEAGQLFALKNEPPKQQPMLVALKSVDDANSARVIVDPNAIDPTGGTTIDWYVPSHDAKLIAVSLSSGGDESGTVHVYDAATGKEISETDVIPRAHGGTAGGSLAWESDNSGFYYTRYPRAGERPNPEDLNFYVQVYFHKLGTPTAQDEYIIGKDFVRIAEVVIETDEHGHWLLVSVQNGDGGEFEHHLRDSKKVWTKLTSFKDKVVEANFGKDALYLVSREGAPRGKVLRLPLSSGAPTLSAAKEIIPQAEGSIATDFFNNAGILPTDSRLYVLYQAGGPNELRTFDVGGQPLADVPLPPVSAVNELVRASGDSVLFSSESFISPPAWMAFEPGGAVKKTALFQTSPVDLSKDFEVVREFATSKDGTKVPISIIRSKAIGSMMKMKDNPPPATGQSTPDQDRAYAAELMKQLEANPRPATPVYATTATSERIELTNHLDSIHVRAAAPLPAPTVVWGYGGYGVSEAPGFSPRRALFIEQGGVFAIANIRGGGEYGEEWHRAGNLVNKQNVFDDFYAAAKHMIDRGYTTKDKLAIMGGSNGGLLMGATFTQHPDLCKAVVSSVGIYDMLRVELSPNGAFNVTEFGTVKDPAQYKALRAYSPFHAVKDGTHYPAVLMLTGANDPRVDPMHSRKMTARLQAADPQGTFLLRTSANAGHGVGSSLNERIEQNVDIYAFLFDQLGVSYKPMAAPSNPPRSLSRDRH